MTTPLRIALMMQGGTQWIGGLEYIKNLIIALATLPEDVRSTFELNLLGDPQTLNMHISDSLNPYIAHRYEVDKAMIKHLTAIQRLTKKLHLNNIWKPSSSFQIFLRQQKFDFIYPHTPEPGQKASCHSAAWIPDFQHKHLPQFFTPQDISTREKRMVRIANHAEKIVLSSHVAEQDFHRFFPHAAAKTHVLSFRTYPVQEWYESVPQHIQSRYCLPERFFLVCNQFWQHKNHRIIFQALKELQQQSIFPHVVCTGHFYDYRHPGYSDEILHTIHTLGIARQVSLLGLIPRIEQIQLMRRSLAIIQPSLFEGWSTVVEDARCLGKPMLLSDIPVHVEQSPPQSKFFRQDSVEELASLLSKWWTSGTPGPQEEQEAAARQQSFRDVQEFALRFLELARG